MWYFDIPKLGPSVGFQEEEEAAQVRLNVSVAIGVPVGDMPLYTPDQPPQEPTPQDSQA